MVFEGGMSKRIIAASADASTAAANPAAMTHLDRSRVLAAAQGIYIDLQFDTKKSGFDGGDGGNAGEFAPASSLHRLDPGWPLAPARLPFLSLQRQGRNIFRGARCSGGHQGQEKPRQAASGRQPDCGVSRGRRVLGHAGRHAFSQPAVLVCLLVRHGGSRHDGEQPDHWLHCRIATGRASTGPGDAALTGGNR